MAATATALDPVAGPAVVRAPGLLPVANPLRRETRYIKRTEAKTRETGDAQCRGQSFSFSLLDFPDLFQPRLLVVLGIARVPMDILVLLPPTGGGVDTMP